MSGSGSSHCGAGESRSDSRASSVSMETSSVIAMSEMSPRQHTTMKASHAIYMSQTLEQTIYIYRYKQPNIQGQVVQN